MESQAMPHQNPRYNSFLQSISSADIEAQSSLLGDKAQPTKIRWRIVAIIILIMAVTALNRLNLSIAGKRIEGEFSIDTISMGKVFSSFLWGYAFFQIPWGYVCDRIGPLRTLTASILCFGFGAALMGVAPRIAAASGISILLGFQIIRFFTGVAEAAVSSNCVRAIAAWTAPHERGLAAGLQSGGLGLGGTITPVLIAWSTIHYGWRASFYLCAFLAFLCVVIWRWYATDWPEQHPHVNDAELNAIHPQAVSRSGQRMQMSNAKRVPWVKMLSSISVWGLILAYGCQGYSFYVYYNWFYFYSVKVRGLGLMEAAVWTSLPFLAMGVLSPLGGWFSDRISRFVGRRRGRLYAVLLGMSVSAAFLYSGSHLKITSIALPLIALAAGFNYFATSNFWASCIDLAPDFSASLSALMNTIGNIGGAISSTVTASIAVHQGWSSALDLAAVVTLASGLLFLVVNAGETIERQKQGADWAHA